MIRLTRSTILIAALACACSGSQQQQPTGGGGAGPAGGGTPAAGGPQVKLETSLGAITVALDEKRAPKTVANFLQYVRAGHYDGTIFHRVMADFMIQGGGFTPQMQKKPTRAPIHNEADNGLTNGRGTIAMARTPMPHTASAQFFINVKDNPALNFRSRDARGWGYCVFGKVVSGMDVVDRIRAVAVQRVGPHGHVPVTPVLIKKATVVGGS